MSQEQLKCACGNDDPSRFAIEQRQYTLHRFEVKDGLVVIEGHPCITYEDTHHKDVLCCRSCGKTQEMPAHWKAFDYA